METNKTFENVKEMLNKRELKQALRVLGDVAIFVIGMDKMISGSDEDHPLRLLVGGLMSEFGFYRVFKNARELGSLEGKDEILDSFKEAMDFGTEEKKEE